MQAYECPGEFKEFLGQITLSELMDLHASLGAFPEDALFREAAEDEIRLRIKGLKLAAERSQNRRRRNV